MIEPAVLEPLKVSVEGLDSLNGAGWPEWVSLSLAAASLVLSCYVFFKNRSDSERQNETLRRLDLMKTLVLDPNMPKIYNTFDGLTRCLSNLRDRDCNRSEVEQELQSIFKNLNEDTLSIFFAIDQELYSRLKDASDNSRDILVENMADEGINLHVERMYNEHIMKHAQSLKQKIIEQLYNYK